MHMYAHFSPDRTFPAAEPDVDPLPGPSNDDTDVESDDPDAVHNDIGSDGADSGDDDEPDVYDRDVFLESEDELDTTANQDGRHYAVSDSEVEDEDDVDEGTVLTSIFTSITYIYLFVASLWISILVMATYRHR